MVLARECFHYTDEDIGHASLVSLSLRLKDLQGPVTRVKKKKKKKRLALCDAHQLVGNRCTDVLKAQGPSRTCNESKEEEEVMCVFIFTRQRYARRARI